MRHQDKYASSLFCFEIWTLSLSLSLCRCSPNTSPADNTEWKKKKKKDSWDTTVRTEAREPAATFKLLKKRKKKHIYLHQGKYFLPTEPDYCEDLYQIAQTHTSQHHKYVSSLTSTPKCPPWPIPHPFTVCGANQIFAFCIILLTDRQTQVKHNLGTSREKLRLIPHVHFYFDWGGRGFTRE